jgi:chromosome segregation ATPase
VVKGIVEISKEQIDAAVQAELSTLRKQVKSLESKLKRREAEMTRLRDGMDITEERRTRIRNLAEQLNHELTEAGLVYTEYGL